MHTSLSKLINATLRDIAAGQGACEYCRQRVLCVPEGVADMFTVQRLGMCQCFAINNVFVVVVVVVLLQFCAGWSSFELHVPCLVVVSTAVNHAL